jgi:hypothetical protein
MAREEIESSFRDVGLDRRLGFGNFNLIVIPHICLQQYIYDPKRGGLPHPSPP